MKHTINELLLLRRVKVALVGCGGSGAQMLHCLARLDRVMRELGHPFGMHVTVFDDDRVSRSNHGRQIFGAGDVGAYKSVLCVTRVNMLHGLDWSASVQRATPDMLVSFDPDFIITCVDTRKFRRDLQERLLCRQWRETKYWLDLGNTDESGQVVLGQWPVKANPVEEYHRLPCVGELFPDIMDAPKADSDDANTPSCSVQESVAEQGLFVNDFAARWASQLLFELFRNGSIDTNLVLYNTRFKMSQSVAIDPMAWKAFGLKRRKPNGYVHEGEAGPAPRKSRAKRRKTAGRGGSKSRVQPTTAAPDQAANDPGGPALAERAGEVAA